MSKIETINLPVKTGEPLSGPTIDRIVDLARNAYGVQVVNAEPLGEPDGSYLIIDHNAQDGQKKVVLQNARNPRSQTAMDIPDFVRMTRFMDERHSGDGHPTSIYHSDHEVVAVVDDHFRDNRVRMGLEYSPEFAKLSSMTRQPIEHAALMRVLRLDLRGVFQVYDMGLLASVKVDKTATSKAAHDGNSCSSEARAKAGNESPLPETISATCKVYQDAKVPGIPTCVVNVMIEFDSESGRFLFVPIPGDLEKAKQEAAEFVQKSLRECVEGGTDSEARRKIEIFHGTP